MSSNSSVFSRNADPVPAQGAGLSASSDSSTISHLPLSPLLLLPAYIALGIAIGSAIYSLTSLFSIDDYSVKLWLAFAIAMTGSFCLQSGGKTVREIVVWLFVVLVALIPPAMVLISSTSFFPPLVFEDSNALVAVSMGWLIIITLCVSGGHLGRTNIPLSTPLVPSLSLFGLLNIMTIDPSANMRFMIFIAAALYLTAYERLFLNPLRKRLREEEGRQKSKKTATSTAIKSGLTQPTSADSSTGQIVGATLQLLSACAIWLMVFIFGGIFFYYPISAAIPTKLSLALSRSPIGAQQQVSDWRNSPPVVELRGGRYPLSTRTIAKITISKGEPSGLWRTNIYQSYKGSRWVESNEMGIHSVFAKKGAITSLTQKNNVFSFSPFAEPNKPEQNLNRNDCKDDNCRSVIEVVQPSSSATSTLISSGEPSYVTGDLGELQVRSDVTSTISDPSRRGETYTVSSRVIVPNPSELGKAPNLTKAELQTWRDDPSVLETLTLPDDPNQALQIRALAKRIVQDARKNGRELDSPTRQVDAVGDYLVNTCVYSLNSKPVPEGEDAVLFFLRNSKEGACDMFASSMVLLLRAMDVPARLVTGYIQPEIADNTEGTVFSLRERDAHAWVEYFSTGTGWVTYDPTQRTRDVSGSAGLNWTDPRNLPIIMGNLFLPFTAVLAVGAVVLIVSGNRQRALSRLTPEERGKLHIVDIYSAGRKAVSRHVPFYEHYTPHEYEAAVLHSALPHDVKLEFAALTYLFIQSQYGYLNADLDLNLAQSSLKRLKHAMRSARRIPRFTVSKLPFNPPVREKQA